jgi:hypothetical protein
MRASAPGWAPRRLGLLGDFKDAIGGFVQDPIDVALQKLVIPAATSMIKGLRSKKDEG